jgi:excisionase family DNA binding protein
VTSKAQAQAQTSRASALMGTHLRFALALTSATHRDQREEPPSSQPVTKGGEALQAYTVEQVAEILHVGRDKIYYLLRTGQLRSIKIGKLRRITDQHLAAFVASLEDPENHAA